MAAVLDALVPFVKSLVADMVQEEVDMLLGVSNEIVKLEGNMESLQDILADAERKRITDQSVQRWAWKLKSAMYDATDALDLCQLAADEHTLLARCQPLLTCLEGAGKVQDFLRCLLLCLQNPVLAHEIGSRIKELNQRMDGIHEEAKKLNFSKLIISAYPEHRMATDDAGQSWRKTTSEFDETAIVGEKIERDTKELAQVLIVASNGDLHGHLKVVSIVGMGGMGKTTLAQKIFNEATIQEHFKTKIWLSISQHFNEAELLRTAISHARGNHGGEQDKTLLTRTLTETLSRGRFLLVLDDVWNDTAWSHVLRVPIMNASRTQPGSRVLITTRLEDLAQKMHASVHQHEVRPLDQEDAWSLLKKQLPADKVAGIDQLKDIGIKILGKCDGLPLAIKVIGGLLSTRYPSESQWKIVLNDPAWSVAGLPQELDNRLYLSYEDLSPQLKQCFLYCLLFPKGTEIIGIMVTRMWISEGFIGPMDESDEYGLEERASEYYQELIKRNLIEPTYEYYLTGGKCTMHDVVRSFAEYVAREESTVLVNKERAATTGHGTSMLVRRLSLVQIVSGEWAALQRQKSLRTLIVFTQFHLKLGDSLGSFSSLRVLYICSTANCDELVAFLPKLKHLRYLHLDSTDTSWLPDDVNKMKFLQHLNLGCEKLRRLPCSIVKLVHLRSLHISGANISAVPKGFGRLANLRLIYGFPVHVDNTDAGSWCSLQELAPLSHLRDLVVCGLEKVPASLMAEKAMISSKDQLRLLGLNYSDITINEHTMDELQQQSVMSIQEEVFEKLSLPTCLETLHVKGGYVGRRLPNWMQAPESANFLKSLRYLVLQNLPCCTQLPDGLCCLPCLEGLTIEDAPAIKRIGPEFQAASAPSSSGYSAVFSKLRLLQLVGLCEWEEWEWNDIECEEKQEGVEAATIAMASLDHLCIQNCKLRCLPPGLANSKRHNLRKLLLWQMTNLTSVSSFPSVVELEVFDCPELKRINGLSRLHKIKIVRCPSVVVLEDVPQLDSLYLEDATMNTLPEYLRALNPRCFDLTCSKDLYDSLSPGSTEWDKISHIGKRLIDYVQD